MLVPIENLKHNLFHLETREKNEAFGSSLLLANSPMSPKIVNGSFAAIFDADVFLTKAYAGIRIAVRFFFFLNFRNKKLIKFLLESRLSSNETSC